MPLILENKVPCRLLWVASNARQTFGDKFVDDITQINPRAVLYSAFLFFFLPSDFGLFFLLSSDSRLHGEPDLVKMTYRLVKEFDAEAVIVVSTKTTVDKVVYGLVSRGIAAFGSVGDEEP